MSTMLQDELIYSLRPSKLIVLDLHVKTKETYE
jgi:hypothetical protein